MFILAEMKHVTRITPDLFGLKLNDAIASELNKKLANKVSYMIVMASCFDCKMNFRNRR